MGALPPQALLLAEAPERERWKQIYTSSCLVLLQDRSSYEEEQLAELEMCGFDREKRLCNECVYQRGFPASGRPRNRL